MNVAYFYALNFIEALVDTSASVRPLDYEIVYEFAIVRTEWQLEIPNERVSVTVSAGP